MKVSECRPEVQRFACAMEARLQINEFGDGWQKCDVEVLFFRVVEAIGIVAMGMNIPAEPSRAAQENMIRRLVDVANFAMMTAKRIAEFDEK